MKPTLKARKKGEKQPITLRTKLFSGFLVVIFIAIALLWLCQVVLFNTFYFNVRINEVKNASRHILAYRNEHSFYTQLSNASNANDLCATVVEADGSIAYSSENTGTCLIHSLTLSQRADLVEPLKLGEETVFGMTYNEADESYTFHKLSSIPFPAGTNILYVTAFEHNGEELYLLLDGLVSPVGTVTRTTASLLFSISLLLVLVAGVLATVLSRIFSSPISEIAKRAKTISSEPYVPVGSESLEIAELNEALSLASTELRQVERLRHDLIANISHDLRTPLALMEGYLEMMRDLPDEMSADNLNTVLAECKRLTSLVNDLLDVSRYENGGVALHPETFSLTELVESLLAGYSELTRHEGYTLLFHRAENVSLTADPTMISQAVTNLVNNAITYTGSDKTVTVTQTLHDSAVRIEVTDTGEGIDPDKLSLIWDRYYKVDAAHKRAAKGSGLGLSIVRTVITLHGGSYGVRSAPGKGSTFWFELPCTPALPTPKEPEEAVDEDPSEPANE